MAAPTNDWRDALGSLLPSGYEPEAEPAAEAPAPESIGKPKIAYERKGRGGKPATIIYGFGCSEQRVEEIGRRMRKDLAVGGSVRGGEILLQGDCRDRAARWLQQHAAD